MTAKVQRKFLMVVFLAGAANCFAHDEWFRGLDLEPALSEASLVLAGRVIEVSETKIMLGGKMETSLREFKFAPEVVLKGVYSRDALSLTSQDLGRFEVSGGQIQRGEFRLLMLGRSTRGYAVLRPGSPLEQALPPLSGPNDGMVETVRTLLAVIETQDRPHKVALLAAGLRARSGAAVVPLLVALDRRCLLGAQTPGVVDAVSRHLSDSSPAVREQAAKALDSLMEADYLDQTALRRGAINALAAAFTPADVNVAFRVAVLRALGTAGPPAETALGTGTPATFAERGAWLHATGQLQISGQRDAVLTVVKQMPLDAPPDTQFAAAWALLRLDPGNGVNEAVLRLRHKFDAGLTVVSEIEAVGDLSPAFAAPALMEVSKLPLNHDERYVFVQACKKVADGRLVEPLAGMLAPNETDVRRGAVEALIKIDTDAAAQVLPSHIGEEANLAAKLEMAEFLGRHGMRDGYPFAIEHMSEPYLRKLAVSALAAIREPRAEAELRKILDSSNDVEWNSAAVEALGRLGVVDLTQRFLDMAGNAKSPLAPAALLALGDLHEAKALPAVRAGLGSRRPEVLTASARAAGQVAALPGVNAGDVRDELAALLVDAGAPIEARSAALESLVELKDSRLDGALAQAVRDGGLERDPDALLNRVEKLLSERKVRLGGFI